jgi:hypothetical protein
MYGAVEPLQWHYCCGPAVVMFLSESRCRAPVAAPAGGGYRPALLSAVIGCRLALLVTSGGSRHALAVAAAEQRLRFRSRAIGDPLAASPPSRRRVPR